MNLELHILQNFPPSNLNRDDTGSPKSCEFGGYRRARISSQAIKRAIRREFESLRDNGLLPRDALASRTKRAVEAIATRLAERGRDPRSAVAVAEATLGSLEISTGDASAAQYDSQIGAEHVTLRKTQYLLFLGDTEIQRLVEFSDAHWDSLISTGTGAETRGRGAKAASRDAAIKALPKGAVDGLRKGLDGGRAADLALFGRMLADLPERNIDAASQVAHAISTHQVSFEFDYYTAVDDLKPEDTAGADMIGTVEFNSACFYRYANIDLDQLQENLGGDANLAAATVRAFLLASRDAIPTGKQNSFAAQNLPSFVLAVVRRTGFCSLANAFARPVRPRGDEDLIQLSIDFLARHWDDLVTTYGAPEGRIVACALPGLSIPAPLAEVRKKTYEELVQEVMSAIGV